MTTTDQDRSAAPPPVDPRIRARRIEVRRQQGRRRLHVLTAAVVVVAVVALAVAAAFSGLLDVDEVVVEGSTRSDPVQVVAASGIERGDPLIAVDGGAASLAVEGLPWVADAEVRRTVGGTVTIVLVERRAVAAMRVAGGQTWVLVDGEGRQLEQIAAPAPGDLRIEGVEASGVPGEPVGAGGQSVLRLVEAFSPQVRDAVSSVGIEGADLVLELRQEGQVRLGDASGLDEKLVALETMLARVDLRCLGELDLGVPSAPALTRVPPPGGDPDAPLSDLSKCP